MEKSKLPIRTVVAIGIGAAVFIILGRFGSIPSGIPNTNIETTYAFLSIMSVIFGPIAYAVSLTLRYIPEIQGEYHDISFAQQARGIDMSSKEKFTRRIKNAISILMPLIFSSLDRIETISCAMELRAFGNNKKRTWYKERKFKKNDFLMIAVGVILFAISLGINLHRGSRYFNPFI